MNINDNNNILTLKKNNEYIGSIKYEIYDKTLIIKVFYIVSRHRGNNYGKIMIEYIINKTIELELKEIILDAKEYYTHYDKLVNYYKNFGFKIDNSHTIIQKFVNGELVRIIRMFNKLNI